MLLADNPHISPSQIATAGKCGWAYANHYRYNLTPTKRSVPMLTGSVLHRGLERWSLDHSLDLPQLVADAWLEELSEDPGMLRVIRSYQKLSKRSLALQRDILKRRPDIKVPTMTKDFKSNKVASDLKAFLENNTPVLLRAEHNWQQSDFCDAYDTTILCAQRYQEKYRDTPEAILAETSFLVEHEGVVLKGIIDYFGLYIDPDCGEVLGYLILDYKSYAKPPHPLKDFLQLATYAIAATYYLPTWLEDADLPYNQDWPVFVGVDILKSLERVTYHLTPKQLDLATSIILAYNHFREVAPLLPNFKDNCERCEWYDNCMESVGLAPVEVDNANSR